MTETFEEYERRRLAVSMERQIKDAVAEIKASPGYLKFANLIAADVFATNNSGGIAIFGDTK